VATIGGWQHQVQPIRSSAGLGITQLRRRDRPTRKPRALAGVPRILLSAEFYRLSHQFRILLAACAGNMV
jgi:hypothetical protein